MKLYDISQEVLTCQVYPGDPAPRKEMVKSIQTGDLYNMSVLQLCVHNGTHVDAPFHFLEEGRTVDQIPLERFVGWSCVVEAKGEIGSEEASAVLSAVKEESLLPHREGCDAWRRILFKGDAVMTARGAEVFAAAGIYLIGTESQSVGPKDAPMEVHKILLRENVVLLEGLRLSDVPEAVYVVCAAPLQIRGGDGSPCRVILIGER